MGAAQPKERPTNSQFWFTSQLDETLAKFGHKPWDGKELIILGCEAYYRLMGDKTKNDRGIYDDAMCVLSDRLFLVVNANLDPTGYRPGHGVGSAKGMGSVHYGVHKHAYAIGKHKAIFPAIRQVGTITVRRDADKTVADDDVLLIDGRPYYLEVGDHYAMNIHPGGVNTTSSLGCQTIPRAQWNMFISSVVAEMKRKDQKKITYVKDRIRG